MAFEMFEEKGGKYTQPKVSISRAGQFSMNGACMERYFKNINFNFALLYYDKDSEMIGIKAIDKATDNAFKLTTSSSRSSGSISGKSFLAYYEIDFSKKRRLIPTWNDEEKMLLIKVE